jgi:DNA-binding MarR family transcriptional regulator
MRMFELYSNLPDTFKKKESIEIGEKLNYKERTVGKHLKSLVDKKLLESDGLGNYRKILLNS